LINRYLEIVNELANNQDTIGLGFLDDLVYKARHYIDIVVNSETRIQFRRNRDEQADFLEFLKTVDSRRTIAHNALIDALKIFNKYFTKNYDLGYSIYTLSGNSREAVADWAIYLLTGLYDHNILDVTDS